MVDVAVSVFLAGLATVSLLFRKYGPSPLGFAAVFYIYFSFGPALLSYMGGDIYHGIVVNAIPRAVLGFCVAILGWWLADFLWRKLPDAKTDASLSLNGHVAPWSSWTYDLIILSGMLYGFGVGASVLFSGASGNKLGAIAAAGPFHYQYLLVMSLALCWTSSAWTSRRATRRLVGGAWIAFIFYCMATAERDFLLVALAIGIHLIGGRRSWRAVLGFVGVGVVGLLVGTAIFVVRTGERLTLTVADVLNQGSILFIDTFIHDWMASGNPYPENSWIAALFRAQASEFGTLGQWFVAVFTGNPDADSAYGFSLSAEAYMNAGYIGVFGMFFAVGVIQLWLVGKGRKSALWNGLSIAFMYEILYALRGELYALISAAIAVVILALVFRSGQRSQPRKGHDEVLKVSSSPQGAVSKAPTRDHCGTSSQAIAR